MSRDNYPSLNDDLSDAPLHAALRDAVKALIDGGHDATEVVDACLATSAAISLDVQGLPETALSLIRAGSALARACPEIQAIAAENIRCANSIEDQLAERRGRQRFDRVRTDH